MSRRTLALALTGLALLIAPTAALAAGTTVTVRVEGAKRTLLATRTVHTHAGSITKAGAPRGSCPALDAAGALSQATGGRFGGHYAPGLGIEVFTILGERHTFSTPDYWGFWINNRPAGHGICAQSLHRGDKLLFAPAPERGTVYPTAIRAPRTAVAGSHFRLHVVYYTIAGRARPLRGARVRLGTASAVTNAQGEINVNAASPGRYRFTATKRGFIRPVPVTVRIS